jgi:hypothetical protein
VSAVIEQRRYKFVHTERGPILDWMRDSFGIDPDYCSKIVLTIEPGFAVTAELHMFATPSVFDRMPPLERDAEGDEA